MQDALKLAEEALVGMRPTSRGPGCYCPDGWDAPAATLHHARCTAARKALASLETAQAEWGWRPIAEMERFEHDGVRIGYWIGDQWFVAEYTVFKADSVPSCYTHFTRPQLPPPPAREEVGNG